MDPNLRSVLFGILSVGQHPPPVTRGGPRAEPKKHRPGFRALRVPDLFLISLGAHPEAIKRYMGHSSISVNMDIYGHLFPSDAEDLADRLDALFRRSQTDKYGQNGRSRLFPTVATTVHKPLTRAFSLRPRQDSNLRHPV